MVCQFVVVVWYDMVVWCDREELLFGVLHEVFCVWSGGRYFELWLSDITW